MRLYNQWIDFAQLRKEEPDENSRIPKKVVLLLASSLILQCIIKHNLSLSFFLFVFFLGIWNTRRGCF